MSWSGTSFLRWVTITLCSWLPAHFCFWTRLGATNIPKACPGILSKLDSAKLRYEGGKLLRHSSRSYLSMLQDPLRIVKPRTPDPKCDSVKLPSGIWLKWQPIRFASEIVIWDNLPPPDCALAQISLSLALLYSRDQIIEKCLRIH